jgi:transposase-like protein
MKKKRSYKKRTPQVYSEEFRWKVVQEVLSGELTQAEAKRKYNIKGNGAILYWIRQFSGIENYRESKLLFVQEKQVIKNNKLTREQKKIKELEEALRKEKNRVLLYEKIIEIAEEDYGIAIRKKSGAEQLEELKKKKGKK